MDKVSGQHIKPDMPAAADPHKSLQKPAPPAGGSDQQILAELGGRSRRGFLISGVAAIAGYGFWHWLNHRPDIEGIHGPLRSGLELNGRVWRKFFRSGALAPEFDRARAVAEFRMNGDIGLSDIVPKDWRLQLIGVERANSFPQYNADVSSWTYGIYEDDSTSQSETVPRDKPSTHEADAKGAAIQMKEITRPSDMPSGVPGLLLTMADLRKLPHVEMVTEFKCIEGWSEIVHWGGVRLRDFLMAFPPATRSGARFDAENHPSDMPGYLGLETPDGEYYVGVDRETALHPQTLLAYELNGEPLTPGHGAPLRLVTPLKYGIKQLKQLGRITYTDKRPHDYWFEQGYDYHSGH